MFEIKEEKTSKKTKNKKQKINSKNDDTNDKSKRPSKLQAFTKSFKNLRRRRESIEVKKKENDSKAKDMPKSLPDLKPEACQKTEEKALDKLNEDQKSIKMSVDKKESTGKTIQNQSKKSTLIRSSKSMTYYDPKRLHQIYKQYQREKQEQIGVPILTVLLIIFGYLICGMFMFSSFEGIEKIFFSLF